MEGRASASSNMMAQEESALTQAMRQVRRTWCSFSVRRWQWRAVAVAGGGWAEGGQAGSSRREG